MEILYGNPVAEQMKDVALSYMKSHSFHSGHYVAIVFLGEDNSSKVYVNLKKKYGTSVGIPVHIFGQGDKKYNSLENVLNLIQTLNEDKKCIGVVVQLPLPINLIEYKSEILSHIHPSKDIDGLGGVLTGLANIDLFDFVPATPRAVLKILSYYQLDNYSGKKISVIGQSNLVGKPLSLFFIKHGATVHAFNSRSDKKHMKAICKESDYLISCTGQSHLIDYTFLNINGKQIIIDVGYGHLDGKAVGDINFDDVKDLVGYITPVPGGVGPLTVACLFDNIFEIRKLINKSLI